MSAVAPEVKTYRGRSLEELLPQIRSELGPRAVVVRRREGIVGGIGGFFGKRCVEVDVRPGPPGARVVLDAYAASERDVPAGDDDGGDAGVTPPPGPLSIYEKLLEQSSPFADELASAVARAEAEDSDQAEPFRPDDAPTLTISPSDEPAPVAAEAAAGREVAVRPEPARPVSVAVGEERGRVLAADDPRALERALAVAGLPRSLGLEVVAEAHARSVTFGSSLADDVRRELARRIPVKHGWTTDRRRIAVVGPPSSGKSLVTAQLCHAYGTRGGLSVGVLSLEPPRKALAAGVLDGLPDVPLELATVPQAIGPLVRKALRRCDLVIADAPALEPGERAEIARVGELLAAFRPHETHLVVPPAASVDAVRLLLLELREHVKVNRLLLALGGEPVPHQGVAAAIAEKLPVSFVTSDNGIAPADPSELATLLLP